MNKESVLKELCKLAKQYAKSQSYTLERRIEELSREYEIFVSFEEDRIYIEDDYFIYEEEELNYCLAY